MEDWSGFWQLFTVCVVAVVAYVVWCGVLIWLASDRRGKTVERDEEWDLWDWDD